MNYVRLSTRNAVIIAQSEPVRKVMKACRCAVGRWFATGPGRLLAD